MWQLINQLSQITGWYVLLVPYDREDVIKGMKGWNIFGEKGCKESVL